MALLEVDRITKCFGGLTAIKDVSFQVHQGEILGLIGPNGAGKTTMFNLITGFYAPDTGIIRFNGHSILGLHTHDICKMGICRTFQLVKPFAKTTVLGNVMTGAWCRASSKKEAIEIADEQIRVLELEDKSDEFAMNLTVTERRRLEFARALATRPKLLLLDEVVAGLSPQKVIDMINLLKKVRETGITLIIVEHIMRALMAVSDKIIVLNHGEKIAEGPPKEVINDPKVIEAYLGKTYARSK